MSETSAPPGGVDPDLEAAEYVLGTLDAAERAAFAGRLESDGSARQAVARWEQRFAGLADGLGSVAPGSQVWEAIDRALRTEGFRVIEGGRISTLAAGAPRDFRASRNRWRAAALAAGTIAAALVVFVVRQPGPSAPPEGDVYVAAVNRGGDKPALIVRVDTAAGTVMVRPVAAEAPTGKSLELWYIDPGQKPRSMGVLDNETTTLTVPDNAKSSDATTFAVSVEPTGGSKTGAPTGPVVYSGKLVKE